MDLESSSYVKLDYQIPLDVLLIKKFDGKCVQIELNNSKTHSGRLHAIDPVSQSLILTRRNSENTNELVILPGHLLKSISLDPVQDNQPTLDVNLSMTMNKSVDVGKRKRDVISWLHKNRIPFEENGEILSLSDVEIHPPYEVDNCISGNPIVLSRIQESLKNMELSLK